MLSISYFILILIPVLAKGQILAQNPNVDFLNHLISHKHPLLPTWSNGLFEATKVKWMAKAAIPIHVQEFLNVFQDYKTDGTLDQFINETFQGVINEDCKGHVLEWILTLTSANMTWATEKGLWAAHMVDAWGKIPEGILMGHFTSYGDFDECVQAKASDIELLNKRFRDISTSFEGKYCTSTLGNYAVAMAGTGRAPGKASISQEENDPAMQSLPFASGICMPSSCSAMDIQNIFVNAVNMTYSRLGEKVDPTKLPWPVVSACRVAKKPDLDALAIIVITILSLLLGLSVGTGVVDYFLNHGVEKPVERGKLYKYLMAFSFYTNTKKWLSTRRSPDDLGCLHGIRFFSTAWVVKAHTYAQFLSGPQWNLLDFMTVWKNWTILAIANGTYSVDTFFVMSGMLATYNILKLLDKTKGKFNVPMFYIHRIVRITPTYAILIALASTVTVYMGSGPNWYIMENAQQNCRKYWWINLLYFNNIYKSEEACNGESWYLANDMQFYFLSPFIVYPIWRWRKVGLSLLVLYTVLSCISPVLVSHFQDAPVAMIISRGEDNLNALKIYQRPWTRIQTFLVGVWLGWILHATRGKKVKLPAWAVAGGWLASTALGLTVVFAIHPWWDPAIEIPKAAGLFYAGLSRFSFGVAVAWVIFACVKGYGGIVNSFLSWKVFMPLGRLCFCVYLISLHFQNTFHLGLKVPIKYSAYTMVQLFFAHMVSSYLAGFVATMVFESPFIVLQKLIFEGK